MQPRVPHRYIAEVLPEGGEPVRTAPLEIDWTPAVEWGHLQDVRRGIVRPTSVPRPMRIQPRWDERAGPPYVASVEVSAYDAKSSKPEEIPLQYLVSCVGKAVTALVEAGRVADGAKYTWRICAYDWDAGEVETSHAQPFAVEEVHDAEEEIGGRELWEFMQRASRHGPTPKNATATDFPVFIPQTVLEEAIGAATAAGELEAGGVLLGHLWRDADSCELALEVTAQVPAREALADDVSLRFTPQTWQAVHAAIRLRHANERIVGWYHSHPKKVWPCHSCPQERRARCPSNRAFFSAMDAAFHRTVFQAAVNIALLLSFHEDPAPRIDLFGWRHGLVAARDYYVLEESR